MAFTVPDVKSKIPEPLKPDMSLIKMKERRNYLILKEALSKKKTLNKEDQKEFEELSAKISHLEKILKQPLKIFEDLGS